MPIHLPSLYHEVLDAPRLNTLKIFWPTKRSPSDVNLIIGFFLALFGEKIKRDSNIITYQTLILTVSKKFWHSLQQIDTENNIINLHHNMLANNISGIENHANFG